MVETGSITSSCCGCSSGKADATSKPVGAEHSQSHLATNKLPSYVRRCNLTSRTVGLLAVLYGCAERPPPLPIPGARLIPSVGRRLWRVSQGGAVELSSQTAKFSSKTVGAGVGDMDVDGDGGGGRQSEPLAWKPATGGPIYFGA